MFFVFKINVSLHSISKMGQLSDGVIGNTSDFGSEETDVLGRSFLRRPVPPLL